MDQQAPEPSTTSTPAREQRTAQRLQTIVDEPVLAWAQGWVSRDVRLHTLFAGRTLDFAVLTEDSLGLVSTGFFSRRPRLRVFWTRLIDVAVTHETVKRGHRMRLSTATSRPLLIEMRDNERTRAFATALVAATEHETE
jgi:hypothetical protein